MESLRTSYIRKNASLSSLIIVFIFTASFTYAGWEKTYGGSYVDKGYSVAQTTDGGYIITGITSSFGDLSGDVWLIKTDSLGDTLWTKTYGDSIWQEGRSVQQTSDGGYIITGGWHAYLIKTDSLGDTLWTKKYYLISNLFSYSLDQTSDGGYIITGGVGLQISSSIYWLMKTDSLGNELWLSIQSPGFGPGVGRAVKQTDDGCYIITGHEYLADQDATDIFLLKTNPSGDSLWKKLYGKADQDLGFSVQQTIDQGYITVGGIYSPSVNFDVWLIKTDSLGDTLWTKTYGGDENDKGYSVQQTSDEGYVIAGETSSFRSKDVYFVRTDETGQIMESQTFGGSGHDMGYSIKETFDGGCIITGIDRNDPNEDDVFLIKIDPFGVTEDNESNQTPSFFFQSKPNPFQDKTSIKYYVPKGSNVGINIYDILGKKIKKLQHENKNAGTHTVTWNGSDDTGNKVPNGVYFLKFQVENFTSTSKILLIR